jgi:hypothetical protein
MERAARETQSKQVDKIVEAVKDALRGRNIDENVAHINFLHEVATPQDTRAVLVEMVWQANTGV